MPENKVGNYAPYDRTHRIHKLMLATFVVNEGQEVALMELLYQNEVYACYLTRGKGTAQNAFSDVTGVGMLRKVVVFALMRDDIWNVVKVPVAEKFALSRISRGIAFAVPLSGIMSISAYKMFGNIRIFEKPINKEKKSKVKKLKVEGGKKE